MEPVVQTDPTATLKMGEPATIIDGQDAFELTPLALQVAPDSVYAASGLNESDGTVYYLYFSVQALRTNPTYFGVDSINGLFLKPYVDSSRTVRRRYVNAPGCVPIQQQLQPGDIGGNCYVYQIPGPKVTEVTYDDISVHHLIWK